MNTDKNSAASEAVSAATEKLLGELKAGNSEALTRYLSVMSRFHSYSFTNSLLIAMQCPDATQVAGFQTWKSLGRFVRKGEHGIRILAPMISKRKQDDAPEGEEPKRRIYGFRSVAVFDIAQTEGEDLPQLARVEGEASAYLERLTNHVRSSGIELEYKDHLLHGADGLSYGGRIELKRGMSEAETFAVLAHECAHEALHKSDRRKETSKIVRETEAEAVAFVVCSALGLKTNEAAANYIRMYNGDAELLMASLSLVQQTANSILKAVETKPKQVQETSEEEIADALPMAA